MNLASGLPSGYAMLTGERSRSPIVQGTVVRYDPLTKLYVVNIDADTTRVCRRLVTGADRPCGPGSRVVVTRFYGVNWVILGEIETATPVATSNPESVSEKAALQANNEIASVTDIPNVGVRPLDAEGVYEEPRFIGDAVLENRSEKHASRSQLKVFSFGDVMVRASHLCFELFHKQRNTIVRVARNLVTDAFGYRKTVLTDTTGDGDGRTTVETQIKSDATKDDVTARSIVGAIPVRLAVPEKFESRPVAATGARSEIGKFLVLEADTDTETIRYQQTAGSDKIVEAVIGNLASESGHPESGKNSDDIRIQSLSASKGVSLRFGEIEITIDSSKNELQIKRGASLPSTIVMSDDHFAITVGQQKLEFTKDGVKLETANFETTVSGNKTTKVTGSVSEQASGTHEIKATTINLN